MDVLKIISVYIFQECIERQSLSNIALSLVQQFDMSIMNGVDFLKHDIVLFRY